MLVFRRGTWMTVTTPVEDMPGAGRELKMWAASVAATAAAAGSSLQSAGLAAEKAVFERLGLGLGPPAAAAAASDGVSREEHSAPENKEEEPRVKKEAKRRGAARPVSNR